MTTPIRLGLNREETLQRAYASFNAEIDGGLSALIAGKVEILRHYDVPGMDRATAVCYWGRSGSFLLASYLDWHGDVIMLPQTRGSMVYRFLEQYHFLSLREKLIAYADFVDAFDEPLFHGDFAVGESDYYAAVAALFEVYGDYPPEFLESRRAFFVFVHVAYSLALGRRPANPRPMMVYAQHRRNDEHARAFIEDFPQGRFLHTVRDPITTFDSWFTTQLGAQTNMAAYRRWQKLTPGAPDAYRRHIDPAWWIYQDMIGSDRAHAGMEARTRAVRFEDMHLKTAETMSRVADWLGIADDPCLLRSTFNGVSWVVQVSGKSWSGAQPTQVRRHARRMFAIDKLWLFAVFQEDFIRWNYPFPAVFTLAWVRLMVPFLLWVLPMKIELTTVAAVVRLQLLPSLRTGDVGFVARALGRLAVGRVSARRLVIREIRRRLGGDKQLLVLL